MKLISGTASLLQAVCFIFAFAAMPVQSEEWELPAGLSGDWRADVLRGERMHHDIVSLLRLEKTETVGGNGGCNRIFGPIRNINGQLYIGPLSVTRKACEPHVLRQELAFLQVLEETRFVKQLSGERALIFINEQGSIIAQFSEMQ